MGIDISLYCGIIENRGWATIKGRKVYIDDGTGGGGGSQKEPRLDMNGEPFDTPTLYLPTAEYKRVVSEISTNYGNYRGSLYARIEIDNNVYSFENRRFGDYNIYDKYEKKS